MLRRPGELVDWIRRRPSRRRVKVATSLRFLHEVLGLERLHYGLWADEPSTLDGLKAAQDSYSELLLGWLPEGVETILDVGAGVGVDAAELARRGYRVEALSPDPYQAAVFTQHTEVPFHLARFQDFTPAGPFDLVLMSESAQYIWMEALFDKVLEAAPGGWWLLADYFLREAPRSSSRKTAHPLPDFERRAAAAGFVLEKRLDVTEAVLPTLSLAAAWIEHYVEPSMEILGDNLASRHPRLFRWAGGWMTRKLTSMTTARADFDPEEFAKSHRYEIMLFRVPGG